MKEKVLREEKWRRGNEMYYTKCFFLFLDLFIVSFWNFVSRGMKQVVIKFVAISMDSST